MSLDIILRLFNTMMLINKNQETNNSHNFNLKQSNVTEMGRFANPWGNYDVNTCSLITSNNETKNKLTRVSGIKKQFPLILVHTCSSKSIWRPLA